MHWDMDSADGAEKRRMAETAEPADAGLWAKFAEAYNRCIARGEFENARALVDRELQRAVAMRGDVDEFARSLKGIAQTTPLTSEAATWKKG